MGLSQPCIDEIAVSAYTIPTDAPEADGTLSWDSTTLVLAEIRAGDQVGRGYTYGSKAIAVVAEHLGKKCLTGQPALDTSRLYLAMLRQVRNNGSRGIASMAISALDIALWDLKARLLGCAVTVLLGASQSSVAAYGSGGFTSYSNAKLAKQLEGWVKSGIRSVKMKIGSHPESDPERVSVARKTIGPDVALFVDANGAFNAKRAIAMADRFSENGVSWFEEPVSSDRLADMRRVRDAVRPEMEIAAGEYGYDSLYFRQMLEAKAVDVLQLDATRCKGFTGFLEGAAVAASFGCPVSAHCAPTLHAHIGSAVSNFRHVEYFHDHVRIEKMLFDGFIEARNGKLQPDFSSLGLGLTFKRKDAERYLAWGEGEAA
ncbi:enolase C-terminal domain-like protein [Alloacidobacterium sp.]|uniref:enolase C-terminal domain-like protein n=1 Tax=Alloacidobacterium sp. TaxID=2951999 RepID=UPI002D70D214|nr:enolase C-terminal domain-like protein [Alloacidobacterium sp.]HYK36528.1 enolase C-terminal domain-like protein [Alloacidobacterium sp.]